VKNINGLIFIVAFLEYINVSDENFSDSKISSSEIVIDGYGKFFTKENVTFENFISVSMPFVK
jgi:hypothetical protein